VFDLSEVDGAHAHRFRHTLATALLEKGWATESVAIVLGTSPGIVWQHYAQRTIQRQERILAQNVWDVRLLSDSKKLLVSVDSKDDILVDGIGFECDPTD
jgi:integrase